MAAMWVRALQNEKSSTGVDRAVMIRWIEEIARNDFDDSIRGSATGTKILRPDAQERKQQLRCQEGCGAFRERNRNGCVRSRRPC